MYCNLLRLLNDFPYRWHHQAFIDLMYKFSPLTRYVASTLFSQSIQIALYLI